MKNTTNVFSKGLVTDLHPLTVGNEYLTDALNATFITNNGNEYILQNDMGNTLIEDATTGAIMGLKEGFIPIGMKEHGGILYITSYNPATKEGEIGSIPSPVFNYTFKATPYLCNYIDSNNKNGISLYNIPSATNLFSSVEDFCTNQYIPFNTERVLSVGDFFIVGLNIDKKSSGFQETLTNTAHAIYGVDDQQLPDKEMSFRLLNSVTNDIKDSVGPGLFDVELFVRTTKDSSYIQIPTNKACVLDSLDTNPYWFRLNDENNRINTVQYQTNEVFTAFPNVQAGCLFFKLKLRKVYSDFQFIKNADTNLNSPYYYYEHT